MAENALELRAATDQSKSYVPGLFNFDLNSNLPRIVEISNDIISNGHFRYRQSRASIGRYERPQDDSDNYEL